MPANMTVREYLQANIDNMLTAWVYKDAAQAYNIMQRVFLFVSLHDSEYQSELDTLINYAKLATA